MAMIEKLRAFGKRFARDEQGVVTVEWVAIAGIFVVLSVVTFLAIGGKVSQILTAVDGQMDTIITNPAFPGAGG
jgi:Flp pilus assembly pilin Flp